MVGSTSLQQADRMKRISTRSASYRRAFARACAVAAASALVVAGSAVGVEADADKAGRTLLDGVWQMDGYGVVMDVKDATVTSYQTTAISCLPDFTGTRVGA